ncbi:MAG TPA: DsrE family protein [Usitatibacter sp.]|nr:DsrE family protein [Usitatibacter sp.]
MRSRIALAASAAIFLGGCVHAVHQGGRYAEEAARPHKNQVVIQVSDADPARWNLALNNAKNLQSDLGADNVEIEIVAYGPGLAMLKVGSPVAPRIDESVLSGMTVSACENTMAKQNVKRGEILPGVSFVPAGVVEIMRKQQQGWAYVRP